MADKKVYSIAIDGIKQSVDGVESLGKAVNTNADNMKQLKQALKETKNEMAGLEKYSNEWNALAKQAGEYKDQIDDINQATKRWASDTKALDDALNIGKSMTSVFTLAKGAMSAFGMSTEGAVEQIQKLQGAMAIIQSIQALQNTLRGSTATTDALTKAMKLMGLSMDGATKSTKLLRIGLSSIGIGLIIGLVMTLIEYWDDIKQEFMDTFPILKTLSDKFNGLSGVIRGVGEAIKHWLMNPIVTMGKALKKLFKGDLEGALSEIKNGFINQFKGLGDAFMKGVEKSREKVETEADKGSKAVIKSAKQTSKEVKDITEKMLADLAKAQQKFFDEAQRMREEDLKKEKERLERLKKLREKDQDAENAYQKQKLKLDLQNAETEQEKIKIKKEIIALDQKIAEENAKAAAADTMGISIDELQQRLEMTEGKWFGLNDEQKQVLQTLQTQLETIKLAAEEANNTLNDKKTPTSTSDGSSKKSSQNQFKLSKLGKDDNPLGDFEIDFDSIRDQINDAYDAYAAPIVEGLGDSIHMMLEFAIEEAEAALEEAEQMHDEAVEKVSESKDRLTELNEKMKDSSGAQLEQYKQQMADEMLLLQDREMEERRLQKEKEKREKELEKEKKKQRKLEMQQQLVQAIVSGALAVVNGLATQPFMPVGIAMGALAGVATAIQIATITKQMSKLADGGLLQGKSHAKGGIPVGNTGIEVEGGEYVVNKRSTAKYLPLLQQINEEGARHKTVANQIGKMADGGELNYERINSNMDALNTAKMVTAALGSIEMHPVVSVVDINRGQRNYAEVRQLAGANN